MTGRDSKQHQNVGPVSRSGLPPGRYEAVMIDFYGTIAAGDREIVETSCASIAEAFHLPLSAPALAERWGRRFFHAIEQANRNGFRTLQTCEIESLEETLRELGVETDGAPLVAELEAYWRDPPFYADALEFLRNCPLPVCCVSNADAEPLAQAVDKLGASFHAVVSSEEARAYKPAPAIFETALRRLGVSPDRVLHVGDSLYSDVGGAAALGIATVWLRRESRILDIGDARPEYKIFSLDEIIQFLAHE